MEQGPREPPETTLEAAEPVQNPKAEEQRPAEAASLPEPAVEPPAPVPADIKEEAPKKKHHLLRHELTEEMQVAAVAHFGAATAEEAAHTVWHLKQRELQGAFAQCYGSPTNSCNNEWMRGKLLQALGLDARWRPEAMRPQYQSSSPPAERESPEPDPGKVSRYGRRRRTAALVALQVQSDDEDDSLSVPPPRRMSGKHAASRAAKGGGKAAARFGGGSRNKRVRQAAEPGNELVNPVQGAVPWQLPALSVASVLQYAPTMPGDGSAASVASALHPMLFGGGLPLAAAEEAAGADGRLPPQLPSQSLAAAAPATMYARQVPPGLSAPSWYACLQQQQQQSAALAQPEEQRWSPLTPTVPRVYATDGTSLMAAAAALAGGNQQLPWTLQRLHQQHQQLLQEQQQQRVLQEQQQQRVLQEQQQQQLVLLQHWHQHQRQQMLLQHQLPSLQLQQDQQQQEQEQLLFHHAPGEPPQEEPQPQPAALSEQPSWATLPSLSLSQGSIGLMPPSRSSSQQLLPGLSSLALPPRLTPMIGSSPRSNFAAALDAAEPAGGMAPLQQQVQQLSSLPWPLLSSGAAQRGGGGVGGLLEAQQVQQALLQRRRAELNGTAAAAVQAATVQAAALQAAQVQAGLAPAQQAPALLPLWSWTRPQQMAAAMQQQSWEAAGAAAAGTDTGGGAAASPMPFNPFARAAAAVLPGLPSMHGTLSTELHSLYGAWQEGNVSFLDP